MSDLLTNRQLAQWIAQGNGEFRLSNGTVESGGARYSEINQDKTVSNLLKVRKWTDSDWHSPTKEYCYAK